MKSGYDKKYQECYDAISRIVKGECVPSMTTEEKTKYGITDSAEVSETGIPNYWGVVFKNSGYMCVNEKDEEILKYLKDVRMKPLGDSRLDFIVEFEFASNEYFSDTLLTKTFFYDEKDEELTKTTGSPINWTSQDKNPRIKVTTKKVKKGKKVETKTMAKTVPSFFDMFADEGKEDLLPDEGNFFRDDLFPNSMEYFLNLFEDEDFEDGEDDEDDEDEDDDDEDEPKEEKKKKGGKKGGNAQGGAQNEKCKNQ
jgi:nucleosome assembly protein 1-like 1